MTTDRRFSKVSRRVWIDAKFCALSGPAPNAQTLWFRLLTGPELTNIPGLFQAWDAGLAQALRWPLEGFRKAFEEVSAKGLVEADWRVGLVWVPNAIEHNRPESPNVVRSWGGTWDLTPECDLKTRAYQRLEAFTKGMGEGFAKAFAEACGKPSGKACPNQEHEQEQEQEQEGRARAGVRAQGASSGTGGAGLLTGLPDAFTLTPERRAYADLVPLTDVDGVFRKFRQIATENRWQFDPTGWESRWQRFCDEEAKYQRRERERARVGGRGGAPEPPATVSPTRTPIKPIRRTDEPKDPPNA